MLTKHHNFDEISQLCPVLTNLSLFTISKVVHKFDHIPGVHGRGDNENDDIDDHGDGSVDHGDDDDDKKAWWRFRCLVIWRLGPEKMRGRQPPIMSHPTQNDGDNLHFDDDHAVRDDGVLLMRIVVMFKNRKQTGNPASFQS